MIIGMVIGTGIAIATAATSGFVWRAHASVPECVRHNVSFITSIKNLDSRNGPVCATVENSPVIISRHQEVR